MKKLLGGIILFACSALATGLDGCKTNESVMKCPELSSNSRHHPVFLAQSQSAKAIKPTETQASNNKQVQKGAVASIEKGIPVNIQLPATLYKDGSDDMAETNKLLGQYSNNKVSIQQRANGKVYLASKSLKDLLVLTSNLSKSMIHPRGYYERRYGADRDRIALASGTIGLIAFIFSFIPILDFLAIPLGIVGIVLGAVGIRSHRRHMAIMGIIFGFLALLIAPLLALVFYFGPHVIFFW